MSNLSYRKKREKIFFYLVFIFSILSFIPLIFLFGFIFYKGFSHLSFNLLFENFPYGSNDVEDLGQGGILPAIVGSFLITTFAIVFSAPLAIMIGINVGMNPKSIFSQITILMSDVIQGVPAIVIGIVSYYWFVLPFKQFSAISASFAFAFMMLPIIISNTIQSVKSIPQHLKETAFSLGSTNLNTIKYVILPIAFPTILSSIMLATSRVLGESAPLLFTAFGSNTLTFNMGEKMHSISLLIYQYANSPFINQQQLAWNASFFLVIIILLLNFLSKIVYNRLKVVYT